MLKKDSISYIALHTSRFEVLQVVFWLFWFFLTSLSEFFPQKVAKCLFFANFRFSLITYWIYPIHHIGQEYKWICLYESILHNCFCAYHTQKCSILIYRLYESYTRLCMTSWLEFIKQLIVFVSLFLLN